MAIINLEWEAATDNIGVTGYEVWQDGVFLITLGVVMSYQVTGLVDGQLYAFRILAFDAAGNKSVFSNEATGYAVV